MKKIFYLLMLAFAATLIVSCSNDAIEEVTVEPEEPEEPEEETSTYELNVHIVTSTSYDSYGQTNWETLLGDNSEFFIGVWTYLYDSSGYLVDYVKSYIATLSNKSITFEDLESGSYTIVCVETMVDSEEDYESLWWTMEDTEMLSTFVIRMNAYTNVYWGYALATTTQTLTISDSNQSVTVEPEPVGAIITFGYENIDASDYAEVGILLKNVPSGYYVSPDYSDYSKYYYDSYNTSSTYNSLYYFGDDELLSSDSDSFYMLASGSKNYVFGLATSTQAKNNYFTAYPSSGGVDFTFENGMKYRAYLINTGSSIETYLGTSDDFDEWYNNIEFTTNDDSESDVLFEEPYMNWYATVAEVQESRSDYEMYVGGDGTAVYYAAYGSYQLVYYGVSPVIEEQYYFLQETTDYVEADIFIDSSLVGIDEITAFIEGNYVYNETMTNYLFGLDTYTSLDLTTIVVVYDYTSYGYIVLAYTSYNYIMSLYESYLNSLAKGNTKIQKASAKFNSTKKLYRNR